MVTRSYIVSRTFLNLFFETRKFIGIMPNRKKKEHSMAEWYLLNSVWIIIPDQEMKTKGKMKQVWNEKKKAATRTETLIYQWANIAKKAFRLHWSFDLGEVSFPQPSLKRRYSHTENFLQKLEVFGSLNETPTQSKTKWPNQNKRITDIATNFQIDKLSSRKTYSGKHFCLSAAGLGSHTRWNSLLNLFILLYFLIFHH